MFSRSNPYISKIKERYLLNPGNPNKQVFHVVLENDLEKMPFKVGDSIGIFPTNDPKTVEEIAQNLEADEEFKQYLLTRANLVKTNSQCLKLFEVEEKNLTLLELSRRKKVNIEELKKTLLPLLPRFYSIASSPKVYPDEIHLTVAHHSFIVDGVETFGVGSHFLCDLAEIESTDIPVYILPTQHFTLPKDTNSSIILIGPGTGIAPFRAFIQERLAESATGLNWVFFGERNRKTDFFYEEFWTELEKKEKIRLSLAFSRDQEEKIYVQHRMLEERKSLWQWIQQGAYIYVCGDADKMAKDVDNALTQIVQSESGKTEEEAKAFLKDLKQQKRYLLDVY